MPNRLTDVFFRHHRAYYVSHRIHGMYSVPFMLPLNISRSTGCAPSPAQDVVFEELWRLLAGTLFAAAAAAYALKSASDRHLLNDATVQRLQLGFFWFALLAVVLHLVHVLFIKSLSFWGLLIGAAAMAPALLVPTVHLGMSGGFGLSTMGSNFTSALGNVFAPRRVTFAVALYSLLTVMAAIVACCIH